MRKQNFWKPTDFNKGEVTIKIIPPADYRYNDIMKMFHRITNPKTTKIIPNTKVLFDTNLKGNLN